MNYDYIFKLMLIGNSSVGKSSLLLRFSDNQFTDMNLPTIGVDFKIKYIEIEERMIRLELWDTAGQEKFQGITRSYYRGCHGIIIVYDVTDIQSFQDITKWLKEIEQYGRHDALHILVGNKADLKDRRVVSYEEGKKYADSLNMPFYETSAKNILNVDEVFRKLSYLLTKKFPPVYYSKWYKQEEPKKPLKIEEKDEKKYCC